MIRSYVVYGFAKLGAALCVFEDFRTDIRESQAAGRAFDEANAKLVFEVGDAAADG
jgi:hypothetical protein